VGQTGHVMGIGGMGMIVIMIMPVRMRMGMGSLGAVEVGLAVLVVDMGVIVTHGACSRGKRAFP
jgi:hypothetical protein